MEAGMMVMSFAIGGYLAFPVLWEALKRNLPTLLATLGMLVVLGVLLPPGLHNSLERILTIPGDALASAMDDINQLESAYDEAFHQY